MEWSARVYHWGLVFCPPLLSFCPQGGLLKLLQANGLEELHERAPPRDAILLLV